MIRTAFRNVCLVAGVLLALSCPTYAQQTALPETITDSVKIQFIKPALMVQYFMSPDLYGAGGEKRRFFGGLKQIVPNDVAGTIMVTGTAADVNEFKGAMRLLDVAPRTVRLQIRVLRYEFHGNGNPKIFELAKTEADGINNVPIETSLMLAAKLFYISIVPHVNGDDSVSVAVKLKVTDEPLNSDWENIAAIGYRRIKAGVATTFLDGGADRTKLSTAPGTDYPRLQGVNAGYYLEVTPLITTPNAEKSSVH